MSYRFLAVVSFILLFSYLVNLPSFGLTEPDEGRYAEAAREMLELKSYLIPYHNYKPRLAKPPFFYWVVMASYKLFGVSEASARLVSIFFSFLSAVFLFLLVSYYSGYLPGVLAALIFLSMPYTFTISHLSIPDPTLCFFITSSSYLLFISVEKKKRALRTVSYLLMSLGVLTKGPVGFIVPLLSNLVFLAVSRRVGEVKNLFSRWDLILFLSLSLPWFIYIAPKVGKGFFVKETIGRFFRGVDHKEPVYFFVPYLLLGALPFIAALFLKMQKLRGNALLFFSLLHFLVVFLFFSLSSSKLISYIFPAFPPLSILIAHTERESFLKKGFIFSLILFLFVKLIFLPFYGDRLSIRPLFRGKSFEREACFYYFKKPYKAYPFYVRKRVKRFTKVENLSPPSYILIRGEEMRTLGFKDWIQVSETVYKRKKLFLLKLRTVPGQSKKEGGC